MALLLPCAISSGRRSIVRDFQLLLQCRMVIERTEPQGSQQGPQIDRLYADVVVPRHFHGSFTYRIPVSMATTLRVGDLVLVPFGRSFVQGAVTSITRTPPPRIASERLKEIKALVTDGSETEIPTDLFRLAQAVAEYYAVPFGQCLRLVLPPLNKSSKTMASHIRLTELGSKVCLSPGTGERTELELLKRLKRRPNGIRRNTLVMRNNSRATLVASLLKKGWIEEIRQSRRRLLSAQKTVSAENNLSKPQLEFLTSSGQLNASGEWENRVLQFLDQRIPSRFLLQAPMEDRQAILRRTVQRAVKSGRAVIVIVGEAQRAESIASLLRRDAAVEIACLHSSVPDHQRNADWSKIRHGVIKIVVGTRSAIFAPLRSIGLIWIEREEDPALKEPQEPRYHAREVAWIRAQEEKAVLVLGSAHLTLETISSVGQTVDVYRRPPWRERTPRVELVDLRSQDRGTVLSPPLIDGLRETLVRGSGALLFLNRKGFARALICRDCGKVPRCPSCEAALAYFRQNGVLLCIFCGMGLSVPDTCPSCSGPHLQLVGEGTERVESEVLRLFPKAKVLRIDGETARKPGSASGLWRRLQCRDWDVVVGTQLLLNSDAVPLVGLAGVVQADTVLSLPDFRAAERTFHLLCDLLNFVQPDSRGGRVILQTFLPTHHAVQALLRRDEELFRSEELSQRALLEYPPVVSLIMLNVSGFAEESVKAAAAAWVARLKDELDKITRDRAAAESAGPRAGIHGVTILGPAPSPLSKRRGRYRYQILLKSPSLSVAVKAVRGTVKELEELYPARVAKFDVDVDPAEML